MKYFPGIFVILPQNTGGTDIMYIYIHTHKLSRGIDNWDLDVEIRTCVACTLQAAQCGIPSTPCVGLHFVEQQLGS